MKKGHAHAHAGHHITPISTYVKTLIALTLLMILTILVYVVNLGEIIAGKGPAESYINNGIALTIACIKATIVVMFFMGVKYGTNLIKLYALTGFVWFSLMFLMFGDYFTRDWEPVKGWYQGDTAKTRQESQIRIPMEGMGDGQGRIDENRGH